MAEPCHSILIRFKCQVLSRSFPVSCLLNLNPRYDSVCSSQQPLLHLRVQFYHQPNPICATNLPSSMSLDMEASFPLASAIMKTRSKLGNSKLTLSSRPWSNFESGLNHCISARLQCVEQQSKHACRNHPFSSGVQPLNHILHLFLTWEMLAAECHDKQLYHWES